MYNIYISYTRTHAHTHTHNMHTYTWRKSWLLVSATVLNLIPKVSGSVVQSPSTFHLCATNPPILFSVVV
jgi:hypothetical protein